MIHETCVLFPAPPLLPWVTLTKLFHCLVFWLCHLWKWVGWCPKPFGSLWTQEPSTIAQPDVAFPCGIWCRCAPRLSSCRSVPLQTPWGISVSPLQAAVPSTETRPVPAARDLWEGHLPEHGAALGTVPFGLSCWETPCSVISPAVRGTYLITCHGNLHMSAETEAQRFVQAGSPKFPFLLY